MGAQTMDLLSLDTAPPAAAGFDYSQLDDAAANHAKAAVERFRDRQKAYVIDTGRDLLAVKAQLDHGLFLEWVQAELCMTPRSAQRAMAAAEVLGDKSDTVSYLPPTVIYELSAPSTPEPVRAAVLRRIEAGETVKAETILDEVREGRDKARQHAAAEREQARRTALTPEERAQEDARDKRRAKTAAAREAEERRDREERIEDRVRQIAAGRDAAEIFLDKFGCDDALKFIGMYDKADFLSAAEELALVKLAGPIRPIDVRTSEIWEPVWYRHWARTSYDFFGKPNPADIEFAERLKEEGQREPIILTLNDADDPQDRKRGKYRLVDGKKRLGAASRLGWRTILAKIVTPGGAEDHGDAEI